MIKRVLQQQIEQRLFKGKAIILLGPRQAGKSTLVNSITQGKDPIVMTGDDADDRKLLMDASVSGLKSILGNKTMLYIDEAQRVPGIGITIKLITDHIKDVQVIATGSSSFDLANSINEPLTGRKYEFRLFPLSFGEMVAHHGMLEEKRNLEHRLVYGYYPEIVTKRGEEKELLTLLANSYLYKDLLMLEQLKKPQLLEKLVRALALQVGSEVSFNELGKTVGTDNKTVEKYIDLLEKAFVIFRLPAFSRNVRNEIRKGKKIYFFDCGIRNAVINDFRPFDIRLDKGALWENFVIAERMKFIHYNGLHLKQYFWRTTQQQEIDLVEEGETLSAYEIKTSAAARARFPATFTNNYPDSTYRQIHMDNVESILS
ncbi:MAG TPA: ATP-binding protein [Chitinophagaceae bacterium]|nr:ATP-binding protein [Chitinophagaceae bacterium]